MDAPFKQVAAISAITAYGATLFLRPQWSSTAFASYFVRSFIANFLAWIFWRVILYPKFFSPLIGIPQPEPSSWYNGNWKEIQDMHNGAPMHIW